MNYVDILPQIRNDVFYAKVIMTDYDVEDQMVVRITARRNDGLYKTQVLKYPEDGGQPTDSEILVPMFGMSRSLTAQIVGVRLNGIELRVDSMRIEPDITARYDDSLTRMAYTDDMNNINLDFEIVGTNNPKTLRVVDQSEWGILFNRPAIIEITPPGESEPHVYYLGKNQLNVFNSKTLGINPGREGGFEDLKDGIYNIAIVGSPSTYRIERKYLKTDSIRLNIDKIWARSTILCDHEDRNIIEKIKEIEFVLTAAEANMRLGNINEVQQLYERAEKLVDVLNNCESCGCGNN